MNEVNLQLLDVIAQQPYPLLFATLLTGIHLMQTGMIEANLVTLNEKFQLSYLPDLINAKVTGAEKATLGTSDVSFHQQEYLRLCQALEESGESSDLPDEPSAQSDLHELLLRLRLGQ